MDNIYNSQIISTILSERHINLGTIFGECFHKHIQVLAILPCCEYILDNINTFSKYFPNIILCDNHKKGRICNGIKIIGQDELDNVIPDIQAYLVATSTPSVEKIFLKRIPHDKIMLYNTFAERVTRRVAGYARLKVLLNCVSKHSIKNNFAAKNKCLIAERLIQTFRKAFIRSTQMCKALLFDDEGFREITLRLRITRFIYWQLHIILVICFIIYNKGLLVTRHMFCRVFPQKQRQNIFDGSLIDNILKSYWKYSLYGLMFKIEEGYYYSGLELKSPSLEIGTGDCITSNIFFNGKKIDIASDAAWRAFDFADAKSSKTSILRIFNNFIAFDVGAIPFKKSSIKDIVMVHIVDHIPDLDSALNEMSRVLQDGGNLYFSGFSDHWRRLLGAKQQQKMPIYYDYHYNLFNHDEWDTILREKGFRQMNHGYFLTGKMARFYYIASLLYFAKRDGLKCFERWQHLDKWYEEMLVNVFIPLCEKDVLNCKRRNKGINFWIHSKKSKSRKSKCLNPLESNDQAIRA